MANYTTLATSKTPALIVYLLDISASMDKRLGDKTRLQTALEALQAAVRTMVFRSSKGKRIQPRYKLAVYVYSNEVYDLLGGIQPIDVVAQNQLPPIDTHEGTDTAKAFIAAADLIGRQLPYMDGHPAPLICHLTDDKYTGQDPEPIVKAIRRMGNQDGKVLVQNIYISDQLGDFHNRNVYDWTGIQLNTHLSDAYAQKLRAMSSPLPTSYHLMMGEMGSAIAPNSVMMLPGNTPEFISLGFQMSSATGIGQAQ